VTSASAAVGLGGALLRYRVMAFAVGVGLLVLVFVGVPLQIWADRPAVVHVVGPIHGFLYVVYLLTATDLVRRAGWPARELVGMVLAGFVPFAAFVVERRVVRRAASSIASPGRNEGLNQP
jgi:integral membrane protein